MTRLLLVGLSVSLALALVLAAACSAHVDCDCIAPGFAIDIPDNIAATVTSVTVSGGPCAGVTAQCNAVVPDAGPCSYYYVQLIGRGTGTCTVTVQFQDGHQFVGTSQVTTGGNTCCADLPYGNDVEVTPP
jgi:hypothetical protein